MIPEARRIRSGAGDSARRVRAPFLGLRPLRAVLLLSALFLGAACGPGGYDERPWSGEQVVSWYCVSCHRIGVNGAPRMGVAADWAPRLAERGASGLLERTVEGVAPHMPPRGLCRQCTEAELAAAIEAMIPGGDDLAARRRGEAGPRAGARRMPMDYPGGGTSGPEQAALP